MNVRDRDDEGRARSARPRDGLGRPLPYGAPGVERQPEGVVRAPAETVAQAQLLLDAGMPFHAHEVFEDAWKSGPSEQAPLWRGLAQLAVGLTHAARGNAVGGARLLRRGADALAELEAEAEGGAARAGAEAGGAAGPAGPTGAGGAGAGHAPYGIDVPGLVRWARELAGRVEAGQAVDAAAEAPHLAARPGSA
ncbi:DUF309 domain-containing protein [Streptomyces cirratus]|uniref:DUF309 domain-containing protein n=1 Tax=Streptomyces cirratus TaxID=68187 RepID=UPI00167CB87A|nr:DUF309 domain-containing protein [Streptomyces cirratus]